MSRRLKDNEGHGWGMEDPDVLLMNEAMEIETLQALLRN